nr:ribosomal protein L2 [Tanacetum cinerariifolium]
MLMEKEEIVKLVEEEEMADLKLHVCGNVIDQEDLYKFDEEALDLEDFKVLIAKPNCQLHCGNITSYPFGLSVLDTGCALDESFYLTCYVGNPYLDSADKLHTTQCSSQVGSCMPISMMRIGTIIHNIEMNPGQRGKLVRAAGTSAKILKEPSAAKLCLIRLPSGVEKLIDSRCRATIGVVSNPEHATKKLRKAGHSRWLGGGEGKSKSSGFRLVLGGNRVKVVIKQAHLRRGN